MQEALCCIYSHSPKVLGGSAVTSKRQGVVGEGCITACGVIHLDGTSEWTRNECDERDDEKKGKGGRVGRNERSEEGRMG